MNCRYCGMELDEMSYDCPACFKPKAKAMKTRYHFIRFEQMTDNDWICVCNKDNSPLGMLEWYPRWKRWTFVPADLTRFSADCLQDVIHFMWQLRNP